MFCEEKQLLMPMKAPNGTEWSQWIPLEQIIHIIANHSIHLTPIEPNVWSFGSDFGSETV